MVTAESYRRELNNLYDGARAAGFSPSEINEAVNNGFGVIENRRSNSRRVTILATLLTILCLSAIGYDGKYLRAAVQRNLQNFIYPGLKLWRTLALPVVTAYPPLSELYDEWCLMENPAFYVNEMDCRPCSVANFVPDLTNRSIPRSFDPGIPYCKTEGTVQVRMDDVKRLIRENRGVFERDAPKVESNNGTYRTINDLAENEIGERSSERRNHVGWRINRMEPARIVRELFPRPRETPVWFEQSVERFILFDEPESPAYPLPATECANVMVRSSAGTRLIRIVPSPECRSSCEPKTVLLSPGKILWYNWWYWRPLSLPGDPRDLAVTYVASFC